MVVSHKRVIFKIETEMAVNRKNIKDAKVVYAGQKEMVWHYPFLHLKRDPVIKAFEFFY
jgi:hypothetical protein